MDLNYIPALHKKVLILHIIASKIVIQFFGLHRKQFKKEKKYDNLLKIVIFYT